MVPSMKILEFFLFHLETQSPLKLAILCLLANFVTARRDTAYKIDFSMYEPEGREFESLRARHLTSSEKYADS
jgi:hypothetical protein